MADRPVGIVAQRINGADRHHRPLERAHPIEGERGDEHADDGIGADLVPCAVQRHQAVDHPAPARHPQHDGKHHAQRLRPIRQGGEVQVVRPGPDIEEDQRPEVDDGKPVGIDRLVRLLGHEIIHHAQKARRQEETDGVMAIPPLRQRILHARKQRIGFRRKAHRHGKVVHHMQQRDGDDEGQVEPVGDIDMRLGALQDGAHEHHQIGDPHDGQPQVHIPFRLGIFARLGDAEHIAGGRQHDEQLIAPENEPGEIAIGQPRPAGALHHVKARRQQRIAAKGEDHGRGVQRPQPPEGGELQIEVQQREGELGGDHHPHQQPDDAPEAGGDHPGADDIILVFLLGMIRQDPCARGGEAGAPQGEDGGDHRRQQNDHAMCGEGPGGRRGDHEQRHDRGEQICPCLE